jgi:3-oxoacyl-[acyl-carrier-protein] synthase-3
MGYRILSVGSYVPNNVLDNHDLERMVETSDEWITERTGIKERRIASPEEATSDLAFHASIQALNRAGLKASHIDAIIVATATPDMPFPPTACLVQKRIGARNIFCMDMEAACPGFLFALDVARGLLAMEGNYRKVLVIGAETLTRIVDWEDRSTCVLFGDGAGAVIIEKDDSDYGILASEIGGDGGLSDLLLMPAGGSRLPATHETVEKRLHFLKMKGREVFRYAVVKMGDASLKVLEKAGVRAEELDWVIPHQANLRIIEALRERLSIPREKVYVNIHRYGNTSAASIPIALSEMYEMGLLKEGPLILLVSFVAGFTWAATLLRWG